MAEIKKSEISEKGLLDGFIKDANKGIKAIDEFNKSLEETLSLQEQFIKQSKKDTTSKGLKKQAENFKKVDTTIKTLNDTRKVSLQLSKDREKAELKLKKLNSDKIQETVQLNRLAKEQNAINKDTEIISSKTAGTLEKLAASSRKLRREREKLNLDTEKGRKRLKEINTELDKNNKIILKNSDSLKKQKINVGNYTSSIKEAAQASGLFGGILGKLNAVQETLGALTKKNVAVEETDVVVKQQQALATSRLTVVQRGLNIATGKGVKALKLFKTALISTGVGALVVALGGLVAFLTRSQAGVDGLTTGMAGLTASFDVIIDRFAVVGEGIADIFSGDVVGGLDKIKNAFSGIGDELVREVELATDLKRLTIELTREQKLFEAEQAAALTIAKELNLVSRDKLRSDQERIQALKDANKIEVELAEKQLVLQEAALAASLDSISADKTRLELGSEQLEFIERIKAGEIGVAEAVKQAADFTLSSAAGAEALEEIVDRIVSQEQAKQSLLDKQATTIKKLSALQVQVATKNATAKQQEAAFQREIFKDEDEQLDKRIEAIELARDLDIAGNKFRLDANIINEAEFQARKLTLAKKTEEEIQKLLAKTSGKDVDFEAIAKKQAKVVNDIEQEILQQDIDRLRRRLSTEQLTSEARIRIQEELYATERTKAEAQAEFLISLEGKTAEEIELIRLKLAGEIEEIKNAEVEANQKANDEILKSDTDLANERQSLQDARIQSEKNVIEILSKIAGDNNKAQEAIQNAKKALAVTEILINSNREVAAIRAEVTDNEALKRAKIFEARTSAALSVAGVLRHDNEQIWSKQNVKDGGGRTRQEAIDILQAHDKGLLVSPHTFKSVEMGNIVSPNDINYAAVIKNNNENTDKLAQAFKKGQAKYDVHWNTRGEAVERLRQNGSSRIRTFRRS